MVAFDGPAVAAGGQDRPNYVFSLYNKLPQTTISAADDEEYLVLISKYLPKRESSVRK